MTKLKLSAFLPALLSASCFLPSCNCDCDERHHLRSLKLVVPSGSVSLSSGDDILLLYPEEVVQERIKNNCPDKALRTCPGTNIDSGSIVLTSDRPLIYAEDTVRPGDNILQSPHVTASLNFSYGAVGEVRLHADAHAGFRPGVYRFFLSGKSGAGNTFSDTASLLYQ